MDIKFTGRIIEMQGKELNYLDKEVINFVGLLGSSYVIVSGYISLLFGRPRTTEDVDVLANISSKQAFGQIWKRAYNRGYYCINDDDHEGAYKIFSEGSSIRFAKRNTLFPNFELKAPKSEIEHIALNKRLRFKFDDSSIFISPLELQIAYKLYLGSDKDYEDARYLYELLLQHINLKRLIEFIRMLGAEKAAKKVLGV
ncbi:MAG: hypothetical protein ACP5MX_04050 [Candidatus Micrarchaeia archaeon]